MTSRNRVRRPRPQRTGPIRDWQGLLRSSRPSAEDTERQDEDAVGRGVRLAYQVAEDKLEEGRQQARQHNDRPYGAWSMSGWQQDPTMRLWSTANEMTRSWMSLWMNAMGSMTSTMMRMPNAFGAAAGAGSCDQVGLAVEVVGGSAAVSVTIEPGADAASLECPGLQPLDDKGKTISDVRFTAGQGQEIASVRVDVDGAKKGRYSGVILERSSKRPVGGITVTIS